MLQCLHGLKMTRVMCPRGSVPFQLFQHLQRKHRRCKVDEQSFLKVSTAEKGSCWLDGNIESEALCIGITPCTLAASTPIIAWSDQDRASASTGISKYCSSSTFFFGEKTRQMVPCNELCGCPGSGRILGSQSVLHQGMVRCVRAKTAKCPCGWLRWGVAGTVVPEFVRTASGLLVDCFL